MFERLVYLGGHGRSGTTALGRWLGSLPGAVFLGELAHLPRDLQEDRRCTCGQPASRCPVYAGLDPGAGTGWRRPAWAVHLRPPRAVELAWLEILAQHSGARVLVDSSKGAGRARGLAGQLGDRLLLVRLERPRAERWSASRQRMGAEEQPGAPTWRLALREALVEATWRSLTAERQVYRIDTRDLRAAPGPVLRALALHVGLTPPAAWDFPLAPGHALTGNRMRHQAVPLDPGRGGR